MNAPRTLICVVVSISMLIASSNNFHRVDAAGADGYITVETYVDNLWKNSTGHWWACFGWDNPNGIALTVSAADENYMAPTDGSYYGDVPPSSFASGRHFCQFQAHAPVETLGMENLAWHLISWNNASRVCEVLVN